RGEGRRRARDHALPGAVAAAHAVAVRGRLARRTAWAVAARAPPPAAPARDRRRAGAGMSAAQPPPPRRRVSQTPAAPLALAAGLALGTLLRGVGAPWAAWLADGLSLVGQLWVAALRMTVVPLMIALTLATILGAPRDASVGALGLRTVAVFVALLIAGGV